MIGVDNPNDVPLSIFYIITIGVTSIIFVGSLLIIAVNKFLAFQKGKNLVKEINITLDNDYGKETIIRFNGSRYNKPIFNTVLAITNTFLLCGGAIYYIASFHNECSHSEYIQRFWFIWGVKLVIITIIPVVMVAFFLKDFRTFIVKMFSKWKKENFCKYVFFNIELADSLFFEFNQYWKRNLCICFCARNFNTKSLKMYAYVNINKLKDWNTCSVIFKIFWFFILHTSYLTLGSANRIWLG